MCDDLFEKTWEIHCGDSVNKSVVGGICVHRKGYILTTAFGIADPKIVDTPFNLIGRTFGGHWQNLEFICQMRNFNLSLLKVVKKGKFPYVDLGGEIKLESGETLHVVLHGRNLPFSSKYGVCCCPFREDDVAFPDLSSTKTLFNAEGDRRKEVFLGNLTNLYVGHIIKKDDSDDEDDELDEDTPIEPDLRYLDPDMPVIQCQGLGSVGSFGGNIGCPIFDVEGGIVGLYHFTRGKYQYIIPRPFLKLFLNYSKKVGRKEKGKKKIEDSPPDFKDQRNKHLDKVKRLMHHPRMNSAIPHFTDAWYAHKRLLQRLQDFSFDEVKVAADNNCQFSALSQHIIRSPKMHKEIREAVVKQLQAERTSYEGFVKMNYEDYCTQIAKSGKWGDHITLQAAADKFSAKICLLTFPKYEDDICVIEITPQNGSPTKKEFWLSHWSKAYYNPLSRKEDCSSGKEAGRSADSDSPYNTLLKRLKIR